MIDDKNLFERTSRAQRIVFLVSSGMRFLERSSEAIQLERNSCLSCPLEKHSARSPMRPYDSLISESERSSSARQRCTSSNIFWEWGISRAAAQRRSIWWTEDICLKVFTLLRLLQTSDDAGVGFKNALPELANVINKVVVKLENNNNNNNSVSGTKRRTNWQRTGLGSTAPACRRTPIVVSK